MNARRLGPEEIPGPDLRCEWGLQGLRALLPGCEAVIIVDVLSFCTAVDVAVSRGGIVYPAASESDGEAIAAREGASVARSRAAVGSSISQKGSSAAMGLSHSPGSTSLSGAAFSLSPASMLGIASGERVVLPSPNGSRLSLETGEVPTFAGCLRNASAVAVAAMRIARRIAVIAAGEQWPDGSLRPAIEDWLGAGAILFRLQGGASPEARAAVAAFREAEGEGALTAAIGACPSARELIARGYAADVEIASAYQASSAAPRLICGAFVNFADSQASTRTGDQGWNDGSN